MTNFRWKETGDGIRITGYTGSGGDVMIPPTIDGKAVTSIGKSAFWSCDSLSSVTIPDSVTSIGEYVFAYCSSLSSVDMPDSVTSIGRRVFFNCTSLSSVVIPDSVTSIGNGAFSGCTALSNVTMGNSVTSIGTNVFYDCKSLNSVTMSDSVTSIGDGAFKWCDSLTSITINGIKCDTGNIHAAMSMHAWKTLFGRIPKREDLLAFNGEQIRKIKTSGKSGWKLFLRLIEGIKVDSHSAAAVTRVIDWFGDKPVDQVLSIMNGSSLQAMLELLPEHTSPHAQKWAWGHRNRMEEISPILKSWKTISQRLGDSFSISEGKEILLSMVFNGIMDQKLALLAAKYNYNQLQFEAVQERWLETNKMSESIPSISVIEGNYIMRKVASDDALQLFAGAAVNCCQHPQGVGSSCAWHAAESPDGGIYVVEDTKTGTIVAQSWVWRYRNVIVFDNVEALSSGYLPTIQALYQQVADAMVGKLGITCVKVGTGYDDLGVRKFWGECPTTPTPAGVYTDAGTQLLMAGKEVI